MMMIGDNDDGEVFKQTPEVVKPESIDAEDEAVSENAEYEAILSEAEDLLEARLEMLTALQVQ